MKNPRDHIRLHTQSGTTARLEGWAMPTTHGLVEFTIRTENGAWSEAVHLDTDKARELFNWLAVHLLTHPPTP